jgi:hypothetical protein
MGNFFGQTSQFQPAVIFDGSATSFSYHMLFVSQDSSNRLLYAFSPNGQDWTGGPGVDQTTHSAPAIALYQVPALTGGFNPNLLVAIFTADDPSNRILYSTLDLNEAPGQVGWRFVGQVGGESAHGVYAWSTSGESPQITVYFLANDDTGRLLEHPFTP